MDSRKSFSSSRKWCCVSVCVWWGGGRGRRLYGMGVSQSPSLSGALAHPFANSAQNTEMGKIKAQNTYKHIWKEKIYWSTVCLVSICQLVVFFCASSFWLAEIYFLLKTFCCKQWEMAKQTLQLSAGELNLFLLKSIELISVEEVSNFQMQTANLCESSALPRLRFNLFTFL